LLLALFGIVRRSKGHEEDRFEDFCKWAPALLTDFNEVDMWMADPKNLFTNLADIKEIESWSLGEKDLSDFQKKYLHFWDQIGSWYFALRTEMLNRNKAWVGLAHRSVAENVASNETLSKWKHIVFAGFNALSTSQDRIFSVLSSNGKAKILWDADRYYMEDPLNEAGTFLRKQREKYFGSKAEINFPHIGDQLAGRPVPVVDLRDHRVELLHEGAEFVERLVAVGLVVEQARDQSLAGLHRGRERRQVGGGGAQVLDHLVHAALSFRIVQLGIQQECQRHGEKLQCRDA
jgi:hypothetical protein